MLDNPNNPYRWLSFLLNPTWVEVLAEAWKLGRKLFRGLANEGVYEVLEYECRLELKDKNGHLATIEKREKIRYLQDYITSYQDQAWGDKNVFLDYRCSPGVPVDEFRLGHKTYKLISLRESRNKGYMDEFHIEWKMQRGFLKSTGFWGTAISHRTKKVTVRVVFPKDRPPLHASIVESNLQRPQTLEKDTQTVLPDGRTMVTWENTKPQLYENYVLKWEW
jgi:hypothetical protein